MHPVFMQALATQHGAETRAAALGRHRPPARPGEPAAPIRQRIGWTLVQVGLRLAVSDTDPLAQ
ncbi:MAG: hypothetical protein ACRDPY_10820 [Streptosporangiaceae bacterium]